MMKKIPEIQGILPINKPTGQTAFSLVRKLRKILGVRKIGHAGTLDPFATGVMIMLIGRNYTRLSDKFLNQDKEYTGTIHLGVTTDTYDCDGKVMVENTSLIPSKTDVQNVLNHFQGEIEQVPPMYSAKKQGGKKLYELARQGKTVERMPVTLTVHSELLAYDYPLIQVRVRCSKGTYIRSIAHDIGQMLGCGAHLSALTRTRSGTITLEDCLNCSDLDTSEITSSLRQICLDGL